MIRSACMVLAVLAETTVSSAVAQGLPNRTKTETATQQQGGEVIGDTVRSKPRTKYDAVTIERGVTHDDPFGQWAAGAKNNPGSAPCGGTRNPCRQKPSMIVAPGLLEGHSGFAQQGPAAAGVPGRTTGGSPGLSTIVVRPRSQ